MCGLVGKVHSGGKSSRHLRHGRARSFHTGWVSAAKQLTVLSKNADRQDFLSRRNVSPAPLHFWVTPRCRGASLEQEMPPVRYQTPSGAAWSLLLLFPGWVTLFKPKTSF